jgi:hypothetical protein
MAARKHPENNGAAKIMERNKELFVKAVKEFGVNADAVSAANVTMHRYYTWLREDEDFAQEIKAAKEIFASKIHKIGLDRIVNPQGNKGSDTLLIAYLNAHLPGFRAETSVNKDEARETITALRKAARSMRREESEEELPESIENTLDTILSKKKKE